MARSRVIMRGGRPVKRIVTWINAELAPTAIPSASKILLSTLNAAALALLPFTVVRTQLEVLWESDQLAASELVQGALGSIVVSDQAVGQGVNAIPGPHTNADAPWFVYQGMIESFLFATGVGFNSRGGQRYKIDSKSMRKVSKNEDIAFVGETLSSLGATITMQGRMLIKLH